MRWEGNHSTLEGDFWETASFLRCHVVSFSAIRSSSFQSFGSKSANMTTNRLRNSLSSLRAISAAKSIILSLAAVGAANISPSPVRSHDSLTPNSRQMSLIVRSLGDLAPEQSSDANGCEMCNLFAKSTLFNPSSSRIFFNTFVHRFSPPLQSALYHAGKAMSTKEYSSAMILFLSMPLGYSVVTYR